MAEKTSKLDSCNDEISQWKNTTLIVLRIGHKHKSNNLIQPFSIYRQTNGTRIETFGIE